MKYARWNTNIQTGIAVLALLPDVTQRPPTIEGQPEYAKKIADKVVSVLVF